MAYATPTTESQMMEILKQIFYDYRLKIDAYEDAGLEDILLERMEFEELTDEELFEKARELVLPWYDEEISKAKQDAEKKIETIEKTRQTLVEKRDIQLAELEKEVEQTIEKITDEAVKLGYNKTDIMFQKIAEVENDRLSEKNEITTNFENKDAEYLAQIEKLTESLSSLSEDFEVCLENKIKAKYLEIKDAYEKEKREVFKYNNGLDEKEKRNKNANISANASLKLRYLEIRTQSYSKEELVDMGYYTDIVDCVCGYYNTISNTLTAYQDFLRNTKLTIYLEDYYENLLSLYRGRAGL